MTSADRARPEAGSRPEPGSLRRELGLGGAVVLGLGSMIGTGVYVSTGLAAGVAGPAVLLSTLLAGLLALLNALSSAELAASHPVSGGTYEYGYRYLTPLLGFAAGWLFLLAKVASAATAALGFGGYLAELTSRDALRLPLALMAVLVITFLAAGGIRRSLRANLVLVLVSVGALGAFVLGGLWRGGVSLENLKPFFAEPAGQTAGLFSSAGVFSSAPGVLHGSALMFVAFAGYARLATLGEEVRAPRRTIPRAIVLTTLVTTLLYLAVAAVALMVAGAPAFADAARQEAAPLAIISQQIALPWLPEVLTAGAVVALLAVLLNLLLGLSRVLLAMGRRGDMPQLVSRLDAKQKTPWIAVLAAGGLVALLVAVGSIDTSWSLSAFSILVYYALTNLAALRLPPEDRLYPRAVPVLGLLACLFLAFWVEPRIWLVGLGLLAAGFLWFAAARRRPRRG